MAGPNETTALKSDNALNGMDQTHSRAAKQTANQIGGKYNRCKYGANCTEMKSMKQIEMTKGRGMTPSANPSSL